LAICADRNFVVYRFRGGIHKWTEEEPSLRRPTPVFDLPVSTAVMLSFLITGPIYSIAPFLVQEILAAALLIPTALILRRLVDRRQLPIINALLVFYFLDQLRFDHRAPAAAEPVHLQRRDARWNPVSDLPDSEQPIYQLLYPVDPYRFLAFLR
jgi:hypothetical protein